MKNLTKKEMIEKLLESPVWEGSFNAEVLMKYNYDQVKDAYDMLDQAELEYEEACEMTGE